MPASVCFTVQDRSQVGEARRLACAWADDHGSTKEQQGRLALVVSELATNLALHANDGGHLIVQMLDDTDGDGLEVLALDKGPGSANFGAYLRDGYSTAGTAGTGLGAVNRASDLFEIHSFPQVGTALLSQLRVRKSDADTLHEFGMINVPVKGEHVCGDTVGHGEVSEGITRLMVADGLGHGPLAAEASRAAVTVFKANLHLNLTSLLEKMHGALKTTRGAAVSVAEVDAGKQQVRYTGVGNIAGYIVNAEEEYTHTVSMNGTLGMVQPRLQEFVYPWLPGSMLVMTSDGLKNHWRLDRYPGLAARHPSLIAGVLFRDHSRGNDDSTVAILRHNN